MKKHIVALTAIAALSVGAAGQASASSVHTVEKGDTLWSISQEMDVSVQDIQDWNGLDSTVIYPYQELRIEEALKTYVVVSGDTLFDIAKQHNISVDELMNRNQLTSDMIFPGDELVLEGTMVSSNEVNAPEGNTTEGNTTTVNPTNESNTSANTTNQQSDSTTKELTVTATAYTASCEGCSGITTTGIDLNANPNQKVISVDPTVIPLGSRVWVEGYGEAIAGDTGGSIKGNKIDIFIPSKEEALNWGRQTVKVKILD